MSRVSNKLTALSIKHAKPGKHFDGGGLYLEVTNTGAQYWRFKYRYGGKENRLGFGRCDEVSLAEARRRRDEARALLRDGKNPAFERKALRENQRQVCKAPFPSVAAAWLAFKRKEWSPETNRKAQYIVDAYLIPALRHQSITTLTTKEATKGLESIGNKAPALAAKARQYLSGIVAYAIREGLREEGRFLSLRGVVPKHEKGNIPAVTDPKEIVELLYAIDAYPTSIVRAALKLAMLTAMRPGIVASARWDDIDLNSAEWSVPASMMKMKHAHIVPLPKQAIDVLREMTQLSKGAEYVFPPIAKQNTNHMHREAMSKALRSMGFKGRHSTHGFRGMLRTVARERLGVDSDILEAQLAHAKKGDVQKAYDRTTFNDERRRVMQAWSDYLDSLRKGGKVVPIRYPLPLNPKIRIGPHKAETLS